MSIIYSYPTTQPTLDDLLIGTDVGDDNATKSFTVQSLVSLVNAAQDNGILTSATIFTDSFLKAEGNPTGPAVVYTIKLAATGTPSATTFLRGDNQWVVPTVSAGIGVYQENIQKTLDVSSFNFTGAGVTNVSSSTDGAVTVTIPGAVSAIDTINPGTGIGINQATGDVVISNTGVTSLTQGANISLSAASGAVTIGVTGINTGVSVVQAGDGLEISSGTNNLDPTLGIDYAGTDNFIKVGTVPAVALPDDVILFNQVSTDVVKSTTFADIQASTLELVNTSISTANANVIENETATPPSQSFISVAPVQRVVTLFDSEYQTLFANGTTLGNTLYLTTSTAVPQIEKTLTSITATVNYAQGTAWQYNVSYDIVNATRTGAQGGSYAFDTRIQAINGYTFLSGPSYTNASGTLDTTGNVSSSLTATMAPPAGPSNTILTASLQDLVTRNSGNITSNISDPSEPSPTYQILASSASISGAPGSSYQLSDFGVTAALAGSNTSAEYNFAPIIPSGSFSFPSSSQARTIDITGSITRNNIGPKTLTISDSNTDTTFTRSTSVSGSGVTVADSTTTTPDLSAEYGTAIGTITVTYADNTGSGSTTTINTASSSVGTATITSARVVAITGVGNITDTTGITLTLASTTGANSNTITPNTATVSDGSSPAGSYSTSYQYRQAGTSGSWQTATGGSSTISYPIGTNVEFRLGASVVGSNSFSITPTVNYNGVVTSNNAVFTTITVDSTSGGTTMPYTPTITFETVAARYLTYIAATGGSFTTACNVTSVNTQVWTVADRSATGIQFNDLVYASSTGSTPYSTNTLTWWKTPKSTPGTYQIIKFDSNGVVDDVSLC
jgi:hypothetical protein